jgi:hypothetical protein
MAPTAAAGPPNGAGWRPNHSMLPPSTIGHAHRGAHFMTLAASLAAERGAEETASWAPRRGPQVFSFAP